jgi:hypothetical protein
MSTANFENMGGKWWRAPVLAASAVLAFLLLACGPPPEKPVDSVTPPVAISGVVRDTAGSPVPNARLYFVSGPAALPDIATLSDSNGKFSLTAPAAGTYTIECSADNYVAAQLSVSVPSAPEIEFRLTARG